MATKTSTKEVILQTVELGFIDIKIRSTSRLVVNQFGHGVEILEQNTEKKEKGLKKTAKKTLTPQEEYEQSIYYFPDGVRTGFPAAGFAKGMVRAGKKLGEVMTELRGIFYIIPDDAETDLIEIKGEHRMREDVVKVGGISKVSSPRYRAEYPEWEATIRIKYLKGAITREKLVALLNMAGFTCGIGEYRAEKGGSWGTYEVVCEER